MIQFRNSYYAADEHGKNQAILAVVKNCGANATSIREAISRFNENSDPWKLREACTPSYVKIFRRLVEQVDGFKFLIDFRQDVLFAIRKMSAVDYEDYKAEELRELRAMEGALKDLLSLLFSTGLMELHRVTWTSPCLLLQRISEYEAVHPVRSWADLKHRVGPYRRCFVFLHGAMPTCDPLVILHTALTTEIPGSITDVIQRSRHEQDGFSVDAKEDPAEVKAAIFYSISSTQKGLTGIDMGNSLIKQVVQSLRNEFPELNVFSTLSPVPGFREYLLENLDRCSKGLHTSLSRLPPEEMAILLSSLPQLRDGSWLRQRASSNSGERKSFSTDDEVLRRALTRACVLYLCWEKRRGYCLNPVANFHMRNGAELWRINFLGDPSSRGIRNAFGFMVNYRYFLSNLNENSRRYMEREPIALSDDVRSWLPVDESWNGTCE
ncbi:unnamed protein product [Cyprideis torosa]|uniref:Uncharacterized protein n=1 Tax=Cyprideis torosa TaxID=163714 RepID=A0A7R8W554_9CRUS|nr:unnamed protein product [Cyprideis torosa]CAG0884877.1 unnamed protein product [Cyprideis torosa]